MQIQKQKLDSENLNNNTTYESINNHNNKFNKKDIIKNKNNTMKVRNPKHSIETQGITIPQKKDNEFYNTDSERSTENSMQKEYAQETKSSNSEFHPEEILLQSKNNVNNQYNSGSSKVNTERISLITNQNSNKQRRKYITSSSIAK